MKVLVLLLALVVTACGGKKTPTAPGDNNPPPPPAATRIIALNGNMDFGAIQVNQSFTANLVIRNNGTAPLTITGMTGPTGYTSSFTSGTIQPNSEVTAVIRFSPTAAQAYNGTLTVNGDHTSGTNTIAISGRGTLDGLPLFSRSGTGANVFDMPTYIRRVRVTGTYTGRCENFVIWIGGRLVVNEILGTCSVADSRNYNGTHELQGTTGVVRVEQSTAIAWTITEVR